MLCIHRHIWMCLFRLANICRHPSFVVLSLMRSSFPVSFHPLVRLHRRCCWEGGNLASLKTGQTLQSVWGQEMPGALTSSASFLELSAVLKGMDAFRFQPGAPSCTAKWAGPTTGVVQHRG